MFGRQLQTRGTRSEVPANTVDRMRRGAFRGASELPGEQPNPKRRKLEQTENKNALRDTRRMVKRWGIGWRVPLSTFTLQVAEGQNVETPFIHPRDLIQYLLNSAPEVLWGGFSDQVQGVRVLEMFWSAYKKSHPDHKVFSEHRDSLGYTLPLVLHGDEGKGKRRANVAVVSLEGAVGISTIHNVRKRCGFGPCRSCCPQRSPDDAAREACYDPCQLQPSALATNMTGHSFLQHWPLWLVPATLNRQYASLIDELMDATVDALRSLFYEGVFARGRAWNVAVIGQKGDLKWHTKIGRLIRGHEHKGQVRDIPMCHICMAGATADLAFEDISENAAWQSTCFSQRRLQLSLPCADCRLTALAKSSS